MNAASTSRWVGVVAIFFAANLLSTTAAELLCASAESMDGLMTAWTRSFAATHPDMPARIALRTKFSAEAFDALLHGEVRVAPFARELFPAERARYAEKFGAGAAPLLVPVATGSRDTKGGTHAIAIFVHEKNLLARLSLAQLREILARDGRITTSRLKSGPCKKADAGAKRSRYRFLPWAMERGSRWKCGAAPRRRGGGRASFERRHPAGWRRHQTA